MEAVPAVRKTGRSHSHECADALNDRTRRSYEAAGQV